MTDLNDSLDTFKRSVAIGGTFATLYPNTTDDDVVGYIMDGFAECQMDGFFTTPYGGVNYNLDVDSSIVTPDLSLGQARLAIIYGVVQWVQAELKNLKTRTNYKAGTAQYEVEQAASILTTLLNDYQDRKTQLLEKARAVGLSSAFAMADGYFAAATSYYILPGDTGIGGLGWDGPGGSGLAGGW